MPVTHHGNATSITGNSIYGYQVAVLLSVLKLYRKTGILPTRGMTITKMLKMATSYTGTVYKRGPKGLEQAITDLTATVSRDWDTVKPDGNQG